MRILKPALIYFAIVFGAGFVLGPIRLFLLVPRVGVRVAELMEMPVMFLVMILASHWIALRFLKSYELAGRLAAGVLALSLMLVAELSLVHFLQGLSISDYIASRDPVSGTVYYALLIVFAVLPAFWRAYERRS